MTSPSSLKWTRLLPSSSSSSGNNASPLPRSSHGVSYLKKGDRLVIYGGENVARTPIVEAGQECWIIDHILTAENACESLQWRAVRCSTSPPARVAHAQAVHNDDEIYIFGGRAGISMQERAMNDLWKLSGSPGEETWTKIEGITGDIPEARSFHRMICIGDALYVFGGCGETSGRLADLHKFDISSRKWTNLGTSSHLRGRGGPNVLPLNKGHQIGIVAGFCGEESNDGHVYNLKTNQWESEALTPQLEGLRPRSVCISASFPSVGVSLIFGGEVDPSAKGHEGAGGFEHDIVLLDEATGKYLTSIPGESKNKTSITLYPQQRGWSDGASVDHGNGTATLLLFGGLSGDDTTPQRLDDLWRLDLIK